MGQPDLPNKILVVDDDPSIAQGLEVAMAKFQIGVLKANALDGALYLYNQTRLDVVLVELEFGPLPGLALIQKWRQHEMSEKRYTGFIGVTSSQRTPAQDALMRELGDIEIITKPINPIHLLPMLKRALANKQRMMAFAEVKLNLVDPFVKSGNIDKAINQIKKNLSSLGDSGRVLLYELYEKANQKENAFAIIQEMLKADPNNISLLNASGKILMQQGKFQEAKVFLEKADAAAPQNIDRITEMATLYLELKEPDKSVAKMKDLITLNPEKPDLKFEMFSKLYDAGYDEQATALGKSQAKPAEVVRHYNNKGVLLSKDGKTEHALSEYERALKFFPKFKENYRIFFNMALAFINMKTKEGFTKAKECLQKALELNPKFDKGKTTLQAVEKAIEKFNATKVPPPVAEASLDNAELGEDDLAS